MLNFWQKLPRPILVLAPMAGITDSVFRIVCKDFGADVLYSEMVSVSGICHDNKRTLELLKFTKKETPLVIQLFGNDPNLFYQAAKMVEACGVSGIDINFGCPAKKIVSNGGGVTLMRDLKRSYEIIESTLRAVKIPVSIKIRSSINDKKIKNNKITALDFIRKIKKLPLSALMIHGRSYEQGSSGGIDLEMIKKVKQEVDIPVLANGGIYTPEEALLTLKETQVDGLGLARGLRGRPWLFRQIKDYLKKGVYQELSSEEIKKIMLKQAKLAYQLEGQFGLVKLRKHLAWYVKGFPGASRLRDKLVKITSVKEIEEALEN